MTKDERTYLKGVKLEHRHFSFIAGVLERLKPSADGLAQEQWRDTVKAFASECASTNPKFDRYRFLKAAGL